MKILKAYWFFYQKILFTTIAVSIASAFLIGFNLKNLALSYLCWGIFFHYFIYEVRNKNEYYFYANFGLSRKLLWIITILISLTIEFLMWKF